MHRLLALAFLLPFPQWGGTAADIARAIRENTFDRDECYRVRDLTLVKEDIRIYLTDGHLIFSKPVAGRRIAAVFAADVEGGDGEVILLPPDRAERRSLAAYIDSPNLDDHFRAMVLLFTGDDYEKLKAQLPNNPATKKAADVGALLDEQWTPVLRNLGASFQARLTLDLMGGPSRRRGLFAALISSGKLGNFDIIYDPENTEQVLAGQLATREDRVYFDTWTSFTAKSARKNPTPPHLDLEVRDYRIEATVNPDFSLTAITRVKVKPRIDGMAVVPFDISLQMTVGETRVDGRPAEILQGDSLRFNLMRNGNNLFLVIPPEPLRAGREYEFEFHHSGTVIHDAGDHVFYVSARGNWYPMNRLQFADYDLLFRYPRDLDLVSAGDVVEDRTESEWRITRRRTSAPIRVAGFNLGDYEHARLERGGYVVDVCANRKLERELVPHPQAVNVPSSIGIPRRRLEPLAQTSPLEAVPNPLERLQAMASEITSALEFMASKFGPPALPHLTVSPIPGMFGQGFPGLIYLSTLSYLKILPEARREAFPTAEIFFEDVLQAHETAHQWWGNRVTTGSYRDNWLMEALANYSALLYLEKRRGTHSVELMLDSYRTALLAKNENGQVVESAGPIVLGTRLETSQEPRAWRSVTYGKGSWILQMLRQRMGDQRFLAMLAEIAKRYDRKEISTDDFRLVAAEFLPKPADDPKLETFFGVWVYGTGIPALKLTYTVKGAAPALKLVGTLTQSGVDEDFTALTPVEIRLAGGRTFTQWVRSANEPVTFTVPLKQAPQKVTLDPHHAVLRK
jgi:Peptidase family M1 domain